MTTLLRGFRREPWRLPLVASWLLMVIGGPMHPDAEAEDSLRQELATMTADDRWVPGHTLIAVATLLLAVGLWGAYRSGAWPTARTALRWGAVAISLYVVETVMHLAAVVDSDALAAGESAPVAFGHIGLALVLYPVSGLAIAWLAWSLGSRLAGPGPAAGAHRHPRWSRPRGLGAPDRGAARRRSHSPVRLGRHAAGAVVAERRSGRSASRRRIWACPGGGRGP